LQATLVDCCYASSISSISSCRIQLDTPGDVE
jgi:hypothetical protein